MWGKDRRGLESPLHIMEVKRSFPRLLQILIISLIGNWSTLISHSVQAAAGGGGGETVNCVNIGNGKGSPKLSGKLKGKSKIVQLMETGMLILAGLMQAGSQGKWSGRERGKCEGREGGKGA